MNDWFLALSIDTFQFQGWFSALSMHTFQIGPNCIVTRSQLEGIRLFAPSKSSKSFASDNISARKETRKAGRRDRARNQTFAASLRVAASAAGQASQPERHRLHLCLFCKRSLPEKYLKRVHVSLLAHSFLTTSKKFIHNRFVHE